MDYVCQVYYPSNTPQPGGVFFKTAHIKWIMSARFTTQATLHSLGLYSSRLHTSSGLCLPGLLPKQHSTAWGCILQDCTHQVDACQVHYPSNTPQPRPLFFKIAESAIFSKSHVSLCISKLITCSTRPSISLPFSRETWSLRKPLTSTYLKI